MKTSFLGYLLLMNKLLLTNYIIIFLLCHSAGSRPGRIMAVIDMTNANEENLSTMIKVLSNMLGTKRELHTQRLLYVSWLYLLSFCTSLHSNIRPLICLHFKWLFHATLQIQANFIHNMYVK